MSEEIVIIFIKNRSILFEINKDSFNLPHHEVGKDFSSKNVYYVEYAFHKKVFDLFDGTVLPLKYEYTDTIKENNKTKFIFFVYNWDSPKSLDQLKNNGSNFRWVNISDVREALGENQKELIAKIQETVRIKSILSKRVALRY